MSISRAERDEASWRSVLATARDGIIGIDEAGHVTIFNPMAERMFGYSADDVLGRNVSMLMPSPYGEEHDGYIQNYRTTRIPKAIGTIRYVQAKRRSGEIFPIELAVSESQTENGVVYTAIVRDATEQTRLEQAVRRERDFAEMVIQTAQVILLILDAHGRVTHYNAYLSNLSGYPLSATLGADWYSTFVPPAERDRLRHLFEQALEGQPVFGEISSMVTKDERELEIVWHAQLLKGADGELVGLLCCGQDVTEITRQRLDIEAKVRQQATVALLGLQAFTAPRVATFLGDAVESVARALDVEYVKVLELLPDNSALRAVAGTGWQPEILANTLVSTEPASHAAYVLRSDEPTLVEDVENDPRFEPSPLLRAHNVVSGIGAIIGGRPQPYGILGAYTTKRRVFSADEANFLQAVANVMAESVARERAEAALRENERAAQQRERLADIGAITAKIVHDLGNPLAALSMQAQLILRRAKRGDVAPPELVQHPAEQILATLGRLQQLVREFTDFAREQRLNITEVEICDFLQSTVDLWRPLAMAHGVSLNVDPSAGKLLVRLDAEKMQRVLDNLIKNAIDAIAGTGEVILRGSLLDGEKIQIAVEDSGSGIPEGIEVFRLFETTKPQGTGIGLAIATQLVKAHGGTIDHRARSPQGTIFEIRIPLVAASAVSLYPALD